MRTKTSGEQYCLVGGTAEEIFNVSIETTHCVLKKGRSTLLDQLALVASTAKSAEEACTLAASACERDKSDIPFTLIYLVDQEGGHLRLAGSSGFGPGELPPGKHRGLWPVAEVGRTAQVVTVSEIGARFGITFGYDRPETPREALLFPIYARSGDKIAGLLVCGVNPQHPLSDDYRTFLDLVAGQIATAMDQTAPPAAGSVTKDPMHELLKGKMRKPGKLKGVPDKREFDLKDDLKLEIRTNVPLAERYQAGLKALIAEMRRRKTTYKQIALENGKRVQLNSGKTGYQFPYNEDGQLLEGAAVITKVGGIESAGRIVAYWGDQIQISLQDDFGQHISACVVKVDNTAMLEALRARLEKIARGEATRFNSRLAEAVIFNIGDELAPANVPPKYVHGLNACQKEAITRILANEVFYLWGPPGTGKTKTLSALAFALIEGNKRTLLCSNTNQAVDQVLLQLLELLGKLHPAIVRGEIIRVGEIANQALRSGWAEEITIDGMVKKDSRLPLFRKGELEVQLERMNSTTAHAKGVLEAFNVYDGLIADRERAAASFQIAEIKRNSAFEQKGAMERRYGKLQASKLKIQHASSMRRIFMRSIDTIDQQMQMVGAELAAQERKLGSAEQKLRDLKEHLGDLDADIRTANQSIAGVNRDRFQRLLKRTEAQTRPLIDELSAIDKELEEIRNSIIGRARIVGATVSKVFLSPQLFSAFDVVIVDEASMVMLPALFNVAGLAREKVVISGDFRQLAPIIPTEQKAIFEAIGGDVFRSTKIAARRIEQGRRLVMLKEQYRMDDTICRLISSRMYRGDLRTAPGYAPLGPPLPLPFAGPLTIVDTSSIWSFVNRDSLNSRYNLMNALAVKNLCRFLDSYGYLQDTSRVGVCTPYAAQAKLLQRILAGAGLSDMVEAGTVHRYQGDEKHVMILDIPDSHGEQRAGIFLDADRVDDSGAMLFNVAVSRAKGHLIVFANLSFLDQKLPGNAMLRGILFEMQEGGRVVDIRDVLSMHSTIEDLRHLNRAFHLSPEAQSTGLFNQHDFEQVCTADLEGAKKGIAIFSSLVTRQRVATLAALFRQKKMEGIAIRYVTCPPEKNSPHPGLQEEGTLDSLEQIGCIVDTRGEITEKIVIIDEEIVWFASLNPSSHTSPSCEIMARLQGKELALQISAFMALNRCVRSNTAEGISTRAENPRCPQCGSRTAYRKGPQGPYWDCEREKCRWRESVDQMGNRQKVSAKKSGEMPICHSCGAAMKLRSSSFGEFYGCSTYPVCRNKMSLNSSDNIDQI